VPDPGIADQLVIRACGGQRAADLLPLPGVDQRIVLADQVKDVLAANPAASELFADWSAGPPGERNLVRWMFTTDQAREVYLEWEPEARAMLGRFRLSAARYPDDPDVRTLIAELQRDSEHIRDWWPRHDVAAIGGSGSKKLRHPRLGPVEYSHVVLQVADYPDHTLVTYSPATPLGAR
jgi:MmyB-like transcription regulator ligand binding domain